MHGRCSHARYRRHDAKFPDKDVEQPTKAGWQPAEASLTVVEKLTKRISRLLLHDTTCPGCKSTGPAVQQRQREPVRPQPTCGASSDSPSKPAASGQEPASTRLDERRRRKLFTLLFFFQDMRSQKSRSKRSVRAPAVRGDHQAGTVTRRRPLGGYPEGNKHLREATSPPTANRISAPEREQQMAKACALAAAGICGCASQVRQDVVLLCILMKIRVRIARLVCAPKHQRLI